MAQNDQVGFAGCSTSASAAADSKQSTDLFTPWPGWLSCLAEELRHLRPACTSLKATNARTKLASTSSTEISQHVQGATGQPVFNWRCKTFLCNTPGSTQCWPRRLSSMAAGAGTPTPEFADSHFRGKWHTHCALRNMSRSCEMPECLPRSLVEPTIHAGCGS